MNYTQAVELALEGNERGYGYLYENTYKDKYRIARYYMGSEEEAKDVVQMAYIKAFRKLDTLREPEKFSAWLGVIVANTAKNELAKKKPILFDDMGSSDGDENVSYEEWLGDEKEERQPEIQYTRQETKEMVHELLGSLSEDQKLCMLMFHIEGASIKVIADTMNCSENTVKSRLNYGRKHLKGKAEELQKKGYKLYSLAPVPLLLFLFKEEGKAMEMDGSIQQAGRDILKGISRETTFFTKTSSAAKASSASAQKMAAKAVKKGFIHTIAGKATVAVVSLGLLGGAAYGVTHFLNQSPQEKVESTEASVAEATTQTEESSEQLQPQAVKDSEYQTLLEGGLTKEELQFVLAYGPDTLNIPFDSKEMEYMHLLNQLCMADESEEDYIGKEGIDESSRMGFDADDVNRLFASFTDFAFTEENQQNFPGLDVKDGVLWFVPASMGYESSARINDASYTEDEMLIDFTYKRVSYEEGTITIDKVATLKKKDNGKYQIVDVREKNASETTQVDKENPAQSSGKTEKSLHALYEQVLNNVQAGVYSFEEVPSDAEYQYTVADMNQDGIPELLVGGMVVEAQVFILPNTRVFTAEKTSSGYELKELDGQEILMSLYETEDGDGLYDVKVSRGLRDIESFRIRIQGNQFVESSEPERSFTYEEYESFTESHTELEWMDVTNQDGLNVIK